MGTSVWLECDVCKRHTASMTKGMCAKCYRKVWLNTPAGKRLRQRVADARKSPATKQTRVRNTDNDDGATATAWYGSVAKIPEDKQRAIFALWSAGRDVTEIGDLVGVHANLCHSLITRGIISPRHVDPYRCQTCRNRVVTIPCFICESKRIHKHSRKLRNA